MKIRFSLKDICLLITLLWGICPPLIGNGSFRAICFLSATTWIFISAKNITNKKLYYTIILVMLSICIFNYLDSGMEGVIRNIQFIIFLFYVIAFLYYQDKPNELKELIPIFWLCLICCCIFNTTTLNAYTLQRNISRVLIRSSGEENIHIDNVENVGGFGYVYMILTLFPIIMEFLRNIKYFENYKKIIICYLTITSFLLITRSGFSTALIILYLSVFLYVLCPDKLNKTMFISFISSIIIVVLITISFNSIEKHLIILSRNTMYENKVDDMIFSLENESVSGTISDRNERYIRSLNLFILNPIIGTGSFDDVGKHSFVLDSLAQYGIILGGLIIYLALYSVIYLFKQKIFIRLSLTMFFAFSSCCFANRVGAQYGIVVFVLYLIAYNELLLNKKISKNTDGVI